ncbi:MAG: uracil-DNA glycosylase family protein, partial [Kangiellaceae bacterium]|nr:uracil-DNA glycosylase family protein [Kangiellaceae bacterium]
ILAIGQYSQNYHLASSQKKNLTETVKNWREYYPRVLPLPHPSPRNNRWLKLNPFFEQEVVPELKATVRRLIAE